MLIGIGYINYSLTIHRTLNSWTKEYSKFSGPKYIGFVAKLRNFIYSLIPFVSFEMTFSKQGKYLEKTALTTVSSHSTKKGSGWERDWHSTLKPSPPYRFKGFPLSFRVCFCWVLFLSTSLGEADLSRVPAALCRSWKLPAAVQRSLPSPLPWKDLILL